MSLCSSRRSRELRYAIDAELKGLGLVRYGTEFMPEGRVLLRHLKQQQYRTAEPGSELQEEQLIHVSKMQFLTKLQARKEPLRGSKTGTGRTLRNFVSEWSNFRNSSPAG